LYVLVPHRRRRSQFERVSELILIGLGLIAMGVLVWTARGQGFRP
jgi:hypothetical protein